MPPAEDIEMQVIINVPAAAATEAADEDEENANAVAGAADANAAVAVPKRTWKWKLCGALVLSGAFVAALSVASPGPGSNSSEVVNSSNAAVQVEVEVPKGFDLKGPGDCLREEKYYSYIGYTESTAEDCASVCKNCVQKSDKDEVVLRGFEFAAAGRYCNCIIDYFEGINAVLNDFTSREDDCKADVDSSWEEDSAIGPVTSASGSGDSDCYSVKVKATKSPKSKSPKSRA